MKNKDFYTPSELVELIGISRNTVYTLIKQNKLPSVRFGKRIFIPVDSFKSLFGM